MKKAITLIVFLIGLSLGVYAQTATASNGGSITWKAVEHDFGNIPQGVPVTAEFVFTNTGNTNIILSEVKPSCGCTAADYTKEPVAPNKSGYIKATYNASSIGSFTKAITVKHNVGEGTQVLILKGTVVEAKKD